jgi:hypothetical protein
LAPLYGAAAEDVSGVRVTATEAASTAAAVTALRNGTPRRE